MVNCRNAYNVKTKHFFRSQEKAKTALKWAKGESAYYKFPFRPRNRLFIMCSCTTFLNINVEGCANQRVQFSKSHMRHALPVSSHFPFRLFAVNAESSGEVAIQLDAQNETRKKAERTESSRDKSCHLCVCANVHVCARSERRDQQ